ncbi:MAG TPA: cytochrome c-type biogenesis protein CcmH [Solirubrobacteraceae bacterium]|nr:cytochrome c-type biogenesis protein CcmH [Solirubrobacteraceae bacterium]
MRRIAPVIAACCLLASGALAPAAAAAGRPGLAQMQTYFMCTVCKEPLPVAQSPEADAERAEITRLINQGDDKQQIINAMVAQYSVAVLALPPAHGFNLTVYVLPPAVLIMGVALLLFTIPRWKRAQQRRAAAADSKPKPEIEPAEALRLEQDLARFD